MSSNQFFELDPLTKKKKKFDVKILRTRSDSNFNEESSSQDEIERKGRFNIRHKKRPKIKESSSHAKIEFSKTEGNNICIMFYQNDNIKKN